jgi:hypothetical protein
VEAQTDDCECGRRSSSPDHRSAHRCPGAVEGCAYHIGYLLTNLEFASQPGENGWEQDNFLMTTNAKRGLLRKSAAGQANLVEC